MHGQSRRVARLQKRAYLQGSPLAHGHSIAGHNLILGGLIFGVDFLSLTQVVWRGVFFGHCGEWYGEGRSAEGSAEIETICPDGQKEDERSSSQEVVERREGILDTDEGGQWQISAGGRARRSTGWPSRQAQTVVYLYAEDAARLLLLVLLVLDELGAGGSLHNARSYLL